MIDSEMHVMVPVEVVFTRHAGRETVADLKTWLLESLQRFSEREERFAGDGNVIASIAVGFSFIHTREDLEHDMEGGS